MFLVLQGRITGLKPSTGRAGAWPDPQGEVLHTAAAGDALVDIRDTDENNAQTRNRVSWIFF